MSKYQVPISWTMLASITVKANSAEEAETKAKEMFDAIQGFPDDKTYLEDSFRIDGDTLPES